MRAILRDVLQEMGEWDKAQEFGTGTQQRELRAMIREVIDLPVIELAGANRVERPEQAQASGAQAAIGGDVLVLGEPAGNRRGSDTIAVDVFDFGARLVERMVLAIRLAITAGDEVCLAGDPAGIFGREEDGNRTDVVRLPDATERRLCDGGCVKVRADEARGVRAFRFHQTRVDRVHADLSRAEFLRQ